MFESWFWNRAKWLALKSGRIPEYQIQKDGRIEVTFTDPSDKENGAYDLEQNARQLITLDGYANTVEIDVQNAKDGEIDLIPTKKYKTFMKQNIMAQAMSGGSMKDDKLMYLTIANLATIIIFGIIGIAVLT